MKKKMDLSAIEASKDGMTVRVEFESNFDFNGWKFTMLAIIKFLGIAVDNALAEYEDEYDNIPSQPLLDEEPLLQLKEKKKVRGRPKRKRNK